MKIVRIIAAGVAGGLAWLAGLYVFFVPAQTILADPALQSAKFLRVFTEIEPLPRAATSPWILLLALPSIGVIHASVFAALRHGLPGRGWREGASFGLIAWALMVPWFEFYLPWNVMHEPFALVLLEALLWALVLQLVGIAIALVHGALTREPAPARSAPEER